MFSPDEPITDCVLHQNTAAPLPPLATVEPTVSLQSDSLAFTGLEEPISPE